MRTRVSTRTVQEYFEYASELDKRKGTRLMDPYETVVQNCMGHIFRTLREDFESKSGIPFALLVRMGGIDKFLAGEAWVDEDEAHYYFVFRYDSLFETAPEHKELKFFKELTISKGWDTDEEGAQYLRVTMERNFTDPPRLDHINPVFAKESENGA